jgi:hypothetical protein
MFVSPVMVVGFINLQATDHWLHAESAKGEDQGAKQTDEPRP